MKDLEEDNAHLNDIFKKMTDQRDAANNALSAQIVKFEKLSDDYATKKVNLNTCAGELKNAHDVLKEVKTKTTEVNQLLMKELHNTADLARTLHTELSAANANNLKYKQLLQKHNISID